jgi:hypothetical protein
VPCHLWSILIADGCHRLAAGELYQEAREERHLLKLELHIQTCDLIVVHALGYLPLDR